MEVPFLDLKAQYASIKDEIDAAMRRVVDSQYFILGPEVEALEEYIASYCRVKHAVGVSSGTDAILVSLMALDIGPGDEVITTPFTFFSTAGAISRLNATPVFVDIDPISFNIDPSKIEPAITDKTKAIIPVHLFGQCADMEPILEVAKKYQISVIEDAAQSIGAEYKGQKAGSIGDLGIFSFFPSKNLGGYGDGGMVVTKNEELYEKVKILRVHGSKPKYYHKIVGGNFRLDALQAAILLVKQKYLNAWSQKRRENAAYYEYKFTRSGLKENGYLRLPIPVYKKSGSSNYHIYNQYTIRTVNQNLRDNLRSFLKESGIGSEIYYPLCLHLQECFRPLGYGRGDIPSSEEGAATVLSIPIYPELTSAQQDYIVDKIVEFFRTKK